jgi:hypothetical protein
MTNIVCSKCSELKSENEFYNGNTYSCNICVASYNKTRQNARNLNLQNWRAKNGDRYKELITNFRAKRLPILNKIIDEAKDKACLDCGIKYPARAMDFDHLSDKKYKISSLRTNPFSVKLLLEELAKCELVCACCHRDRTYNRRMATNTTSPQADQQRVRNLQDWTNKKFKSGPCAICNKNYQPHQTDLDHVDPKTKLKSVSELVNRRASYDRIEQEASKCRLLCANCHRLK